MVLKICCPPQQLPELHSGSAKDGIDSVAKGSFEATAIHSMFLFQMPSSTATRRFTQRHELLAGSPVIIKKNN
jgi:hypothetical protein